MQQEGEPLIDRQKIAALGLVLGVAIASPPVRSAIKALGFILEVLPSDFRPLGVLTGEPRLHTIRLEGRTADVYHPRGLSSPPGVVLVHGAAPRGKDDPRLRRLAEALSRSGRRVVVPDLGLRNQRLDIEDESRIRAAVYFAAEKSTAGVLAFSYGAALALVALADDAEVQTKVDFIATVGTYFDVSHLLQGVTTGTVPYRGREIRWTPHPRAKDLLPDQLAFFLGPEGPALKTALKEGNPEDLSSGARSAYDLISNTDPSRAAGLEAKLPPHVRRSLMELSPASSIDRLKVPVFALHSSNDPASPPSESRLLVESLSGKVQTRLYEVSSLEHVEPTQSIWRNLRESIRIVSFAAGILRAQEGWPRP